MEEKAKRTRECFAVHHLEFLADGEQHWKLALQDTGIGIAAEDLDGVFDEFRRVSANARSVQGMGLGLAITRRLVELLEGTIRVESELGQGTRFEVRLLRVLEG